ncbi:MAG: permease-like cell division protein FtsX [Patescibacteria group bacterium]|jgi:cell division transport system permease protein
MSFIYRIIKFAVQDFYRNIWLSVVTISILILTLLSINVLVVFNNLANTAAAIIESKVDVSIYFKPNTSIDDINKVKSYIMDLSEVDSVEFVSQDDALARFKETHKDNSTILEAIDELGDNPLGATLKIRANKIENYPVILSALDKPEFNQSITSKNYEDRQEMISKISYWTKTGEKVAFIFILIFVLISALIVFNTVRVAIYTHREEIGIEKLVGATNWFVRLPFILESVIFSFVSCVITIVIIYPLLGFIQPHLAQFFSSSSFDIIGYFNNNFIVIFGAEFLAICMLNTAASLMAVGKYLRV